MGIDNALVSIAGDEGLASLEPTIDLSALLAAELERKALSFTLTLGSWNGTTNDDCVTLTLSVSSAEGETYTRTASQTLSNAQIQDTPFGATLPLTFMLTPEEGEAVPLEVLIDLPKIKLAFTEDMRGLASPTNGVDGSLLGGLVRYAGDDAAAFLRPRLADALYVLGMAEHLEAVDAIITARLDLRTSPALSACTMTAQDHQPVGADAFSLGLLMSAELIED